MEDRTVSNMITDITKQFDRCDTFDLATHLINYYYHYFYQGVEHDSVTLIYFDYVMIELAIWLGQNAQYLKQDKKSIKKLANFFQKEIVKGKIKSHSIRVNIYHRWLGGKRYKNDKSEVLQYMFRLYKNISDRNEVRKDLGLLESIDDLKKKLKEIK